MTAPLCSPPAQTGSHLEGSAQDQSQENAQRGQQVLVLLCLGFREVELPRACNWLTAGKTSWGFVFLDMAVRGGCWNVALLFNFSTKPQLELPCSTDSLTARVLPSASTRCLLPCFCGERSNKPKAATREGKGSQQKMLKHTSTPSPPSRSKSNTVEL